MRILRTDQNPHFTSLIQLEKEIQFYTSIYYDFFLVTDRSEKITKQNFQKWKIQSLKFKTQQVNKIDYRSWREKQKEEGDRFNETTRGACKIWKIEGD
jgi:hypothetical protein